MPLQSKRYSIPNDVERQHQTVDSDMALTRRPADTAGAAGAALTPPAEQRALPALDMLTSSPFQKLLQLLSMLLLPFPAAAAAAAALPVCPCPIIHCQQLPVLSWQHLIDAGGGGHFGSAGHNSGGGAVGPGRAAAATI